MGMSTHADTADSPPKLYIRKFPFEIPKSTIENYFSTFGAIREIDFKNSTGFLKYLETNSFERCLASKHVIDGHEITVHTGYANFSNTRNPNHNGMNHLNSFNASRDSCRICSNCPDHGYRSQLRMKFDGLKLVLENIPEVEGPIEIVNLLTANFGYNINYSKLVRNNSMCIVEFINLPQKQDALEKLRDFNFKGKKLDVRVYKPPTQSYGNRSGYERYQDRGERIERRDYGVSDRNIDKTSGV